MAASQAALGALRTTALGGFPELLDATSVALLGSKGSQSFRRATLASLVWRRSDATTTVYG